MKIKLVAAVLAALLFSAGVLGGCRDDGMTGDPRMDCEIKAA